jgi:hypothetical protein
MRNTLGGVLIANAGAFRLDWGSSMTMLVSAYALQLLVLVSSAITIAACALYFTRACSRASLLMLLGTLGATVANLASTAFGFWVQQATLHPPNNSIGAIGRLAIQRTYVSLGAGFIGFGFSLMFAISLFVVLRDAASRIDGSAVPGEPAQASAGAAPSPA